MKYRCITYQRESGNYEFIELGDYSYGEWIVYENNCPKFHVNCFRENSQADSLIKDLIEKENWTIEEILEKINQEENRHLSLGKRPSLAISSQCKEIELASIDCETIKKLIGQ
jgi:trehalose utilization protein